MSTEVWRERALAAEGELARLRAQHDQALNQLCDTALDRVRREQERRRTAPTEPVLAALPACVPGCPCATCDAHRPEPEPDDLLIDLQNL